MSVTGKESSVVDQVITLASSGKLAHAYIVETQDSSSTQQQLNHLYGMFLCERSSATKLQSCQQCKSCKLYKAGSHPDFKAIDGQSQSIGIDDIRAISEWLNKTPQITDSQIVSIVHAQNMTENAANALLKTLEEPSQNSYLFLINSSAKKLLPTIVSRCQVLKHPVLSNSQLKEKYSSVPDYLIGFANGNESLVSHWQDETNQAPYTNVFSLFMAWLKNQSSANQLIAVVQKDISLTEFFVYLCERRCRQMLLAGYSDNAEQALKILTKFNFAQKNIKGQNREVAFVAMIENLESWIK
ncbi:hypothetical protein [Psychrosphaera aestuarii]|uniref:hypothetical protein n=1 Tax=Psychrosphaera aestuarii TaxID=1266052 RepID=UPI001B32E6B5|nr:hypothetical protein [Psychrosphaera aestuarii]